MAIPCQAGVQRKDWELGSIVTDSEGTRRKAEENYYWEGGGPFTYNRGESKVKGRIGDPSARGIPTT